MLDDTRHQERLRRNSHLDEHTTSAPKREAEAEGVEASCGAFGYLRGIRDQSAAVEFRFRDGNSLWFPYSWLGNWRHNPSQGLLLKFSGDLVYLVLFEAATSTGRSMKAPSISPMPACKGIGCFGSAR